MEMQTFSATNAQTSQFNTFITSLIQQFHPLQIFCFSKTTSTLQSQDCFTNPQTQHNTNYCLLLVTETPTRIGHQAQQFANNHYLHGSITIICHSKTSIEEAILANSRFFITVCTIANLIYSHNGVTIIEPSTTFIPTHAATKATKHLYHQIILAEHFLNSAKQCRSEPQFTLCTFLLHQVVEQCCIALVRVHITYRSQVHHLKRMLNLCRSFSDQPIQLFLPDNSEDQRLFDILLKSYSSSRYIPAFSVQPDDTQHLFNLVSNFLILTKNLCNQKIEHLQQQALLYKNTEKLLEPV